MNRNYRVQYNDDGRWRPVTLEHVERLANFDKLVWQVAWIIVNIEYGRVWDVRQLESVIKPERQITLLGIEGTRIKARWNNRAAFVIQDMEFVEEDELRKEEEDCKARDRAHRRHVEAMQYAPVQNLVVGHQCQINWNILPAAPVLAGNQRGAVEAAPPPAPPRPRR